MTMDEQKVRELVVQLQGKSVEYLKSNDVATDPTSDLIPQSGILSKFPHFTLAFSELLCY
jgi:hypothetical protein